MKSRAIPRITLCCVWPMLAGLLALYVSGCGTSRRSNETAQQRGTLTSASRPNVEREMCLGDWIGIWKVKSVLPPDAVRIDRFYGLLTEFRVYPYAAEQYLRVYGLKPEDAPEFFSERPEDEGTTMYADWFVVHADPRPLGDNIKVTITPTEIYRDFPPWPFPFRFAYEYRHAKDERLLLLTDLREKVTITLVKTTDLPGPPARVDPFTIHSFPQKLRRDIEKAYEKWLASRRDRASD